MEEMDVSLTFDSTWRGGASSVAAAKSTRDDEQAIVQCTFPIASIPASPAAAGQPNKRRGSPAGYSDGKGIKILDKGGEKRSNEETQTLLFSYPPTEAACGSSLDPSGNFQNVQQISSFELDRAKHKIFLSHSGAQKDFVEQLCVDLEAGGYFFPFFDQRQHSLSKGKDFVPLIKEAALQCRVAVTVLSEEFLCSKWPMIELAEFHAAQQAGNPQLKMFPLFYKLSIDDLDDRSIENCWMPTWIDHASKDKRIDVTKWSAAVRALRRWKGLIFRKNAMPKVAYRKDVVQCVLTLSPPDLLNDSCRDMMGYDRMCQTVSGRFVEGTRVGAPVLGLFGSSGVGKSTLSKALCDYFYGDFSGRVCHVELVETSRMKRVKLFLERLCGFDKHVLDRIADVSQGLKLIRDHMKREPVFLAIDNVSNDESSWKEAHAYLMVGFHPKSRIVITSRSKVILQELLPGVEFCMAMPRLSVKEAGALFLRNAAPMKSMSMLTEEERRIVGLCIQQCLFYSDQGDLLSDSVEDELPLLSNNHVVCLRWKSYHPLALSALGDFFRRYISNAHMLRWKDHLEMNKDPLKDVWKSPSITNIIGLQFSALHPSQQLLFLDIALFTKHPCIELFGMFRDYSYVEWLSELHEETEAVMRRKFRDLKRSGMIDWTYCISLSKEFYFGITVHALYKEFAEWYVTQDEVNGLKNAWAVFRTSGTSSRCDPGASKCWSDLVRLRMFNLTRANSRFVARKTMQELHNHVVLQLHSCTNLTVLNLEGLESLRELELVKLTKLVVVTLTGSSSTDENVGIYESLQNVLLEDLGSLTHGPDLRPCTSLHWCRIWNCPNLTNLEGTECPQLKQLELVRLVPHQFGRLPNVKSLSSLESFSLRTDCYVDMSDVYNSSQDMPLFRILEEFLLYLGQWVENDPPSDGFSAVGWCEIVVGLSEVWFWSDSQDTLVLRTV